MFLIARWWLLSNGYNMHVNVLHLTYYGEVRIDAWAKAHDLVPLPRGDFAETWSGGYTLSTPPQLQLQKEPPFLRAMDMPLVLIFRPLRLLPEYVSTL